MLDPYQRDVTPVLENLVKAQHTGMMADLLLGDSTERPASNPAGVETARGRLAVALDKRIPLLKTGEERYVLGIVLEPETVDAQDDIYSAAEVRDAAHRFMEQYQNIGLMHRDLVNGRMRSWNRTCRRRLSRSMVRRFKRAPGSSRCVFLPTTSGPRSRAAS